MDAPTNEEIVIPTANPPSLPPTVEEAYRRKCVQLKQRTKEIEDENDAYRLRLTRLKRQIQKSRLERAFLLEQISRRTSTNVEDSEGSPSPPPTVCPHVSCSPFSIPNRALRNRGRDANATHSHRTNLYEPNAPTGNPLY